MRRRTLLAASAAALTVVFGGCSALPVIPGRPEPQAEDAQGWIRHQDGRFVLFVPCAEMGQHVGSALRRLAAQTLGVPEAEIALQLASTRHIGRVRATVGSDSLRLFGPALLQACRTLRAALGPAPRLAAVTNEAPAFLHDIVTGAPLYAGDVRLPGMLYGRVLRAPVSPEVASRPLAWDEAAARAVEGFAALLDDTRLQHAGSRGLGIVARTPGALDRVAQALAVRWSIEDETPVDQAAIEGAIDIDLRLRRGALSHQVRSDTLDTDAGWTVDLRLDIPPAAHAAIEPRCAVASWQNERLHVWAGTQDLFYVRDLLARRLGLDAAHVEVQACRLGGSFGGRTIVTVELEAALLAQAAGRPVKVQWTRAQEFATAFHRPPSSHRVRARLKDGRIVDWWHAVASSHILFTAAAMPAWLQRAADLLGDQGIARGLTPPYAVPRQRLEFDAVRLPLHGGPWRGLGAGPNALAAESAVDACARAVGADPLAFRLAHAEDPRLAGVLRRVAALAGWGAGTAASPGRRSGRGIACGIYKGLAYAAVVADVTLSDGAPPRVTSLWCAHDCGRVVVPDGVRAQIEGNLVWCLGMVLVEALPLPVALQGRAGFADAPIPRFGDLPVMHIDLIDSAEPSVGAGETAMVAGAAAIANAVADASGVRPTRFPLR